MDILITLALAILSPTALWFSIQFDNQVRDSLDWERHPWIPMKWLWIVAVLVWPVTIVYAVVIFIDASYTKYYYRNM